MGTRADFYSGLGESAEYLGSIAWDGYPDGLPKELRSASSDAEWRRIVLAELMARDDATAPVDGWPWPWDDSRTTDYAYTFAAIGGQEAVWASCIGGAFFRADGDEPDDDDGARGHHFPHRGGLGGSGHSARAGSAASGVIVISPADQAGAA